MEYLCKFLRARNRPRNLGRDASIKLSIGLKFPRAGQALSTFIPAEKRGVMATNAHHRISSRALE